MRYSPNDPKKNSAVYPKRVYKVAGMNKTVSTIPR